MAVRNRPRIAARSVAAVLRRFSVERLTHFRCGACRGWWTVGDAPHTKRQWFCPWCGAAGAVKQSQQRS